jgi:hypothetical protein
MKRLRVEASIQELCFQESLASPLSTIPYTSDPLLCIGLAGLERMRWTETAPSWFTPRRDGTRPE